MRNVMKAATLESKFPLLAVENGCIVSKEADVTVAFRVELPELFSVTGSEYEAVHSAWHKAVKVYQKCKSDPHFRNCSRREPFQRSSDQSGYAC